MKQFCDFETFKFADELASKVGFGVILKSSLGNAYNLSENKMVKAYESDNGAWMVQSETFLK